MKKSRKSRFCEKLELRFLPEMDQYLHVAGVQVPGMSDTACTELSTTLRINKRFRGQQIRSTKLFWKIP